MATNITLNILTVTNILLYVFDNQSQCALNGRPHEDQHSLQDWQDVDDEEGVQQIVIASLWYYWKEVALISISTAIAFNCFLAYLRMKLRYKCPRIIDERYMANNLSNSCVTSTQQMETTNTSTASTPSCGSPAIALENHYVSRYLDDFDHIEVLGKGGYGVVFESKHKIDQRCYAVKRICLPCGRERKEKVMREVRALSQLEHMGIVRYYNAWLECPPTGWQEERDAQWLNRFAEISLHSPTTHQSTRQTISQQLNEYQHKANARVRENGFQFNAISGTQDSKSLEIIFDSNASSIKVVNNTISSSAYTSPFGDTIEEEEGFEDMKSNSLSDIKCERETSSKRPNSLIVGTNRCYLYIQMQLCMKETLKDWLLNNTDNRDFDSILDIFNQIVNAVHYVHSIGLMHRDLKPSNIFFSMDGSIKIGDFGLVTASAVEEEAHTPDVKQLNRHSSGDDFYFTLSDSNKHTDRVGTQLYMSPEQVRNAPYSHKVDIFSMGIIFFELLLPFKTEMERHMMLKNARKQLFPEDFIDKYVHEYNLLKQLLSPEPEKRPSTSEIKEHELLKTFQIQMPTNFELVRRRTISQSNSEDVS